MFIEIITKHHHITLTHTNTPYIQTHTEYKTHITLTHPVSPGPQREGDVVAHAHELSEVHAGLWGQIELVHRLGEREREGVE